MKKREYLSFGASKRRGKGQDDRIRVIHTNNNGLAAARNIGIDHIKGDYLSFVDGDDWIEPNAIRILLYTMLRDGADIVAAEIIKEYVGKTVFPNGSNNRYQIFQGRDILIAYAKGAFNNVVWNKLYRKSCFKSIRFLEGHNYEDVPVTWRIMRNLAEKNRIVSLLSTELFHFRIRESSISNSRSFDNIVDCYNAYYDRYRGLPEHKQYFLASCIMSIGRMWLNYCSFTACEKEKAIDLIQEMQSFSNHQYSSVIMGQYSIRIKITCLVTRRKQSAIMLGCFYFGRMRDRIRRIRYRMYP